MKLFAYACLAGSGSAQSGDYDDRGISSAYYESVASSEYYEYDEFGNKKNKNKNKWFDNGQKFDIGLNGNTEPSTAYWDWATALNCWPANIEADQIVYANQLTASTTGRAEATLLTAGSVVATELFPTQQHHNRAPQHVYGSYEILDRAHEASNTNPQDVNVETGTVGGSTNDDSANFESNTATAHPKNGFFAGYAESAGVHGSATEYRNLHQEDPVLRSGLGGLYQYGHDTWNSSTHNQDMDNIAIKGDSYSGGADATPIHWTHYKQARHAGCLYEKAEWHYGYGTYEQVFLATYFQGYGNFNLADSTAPSSSYLATEWVPAWDDTNNGTDYVSQYKTDDKQGTNRVEPIWWHFFNAHILPNPQNSDCGGAAGGEANMPTRTITSASISGISYACPTVPQGDGLPGATGDPDYLNPVNSHAIPLVMANPAYEGLGYLNFIVEYKNRDRDVGEDYLEFIDSTPAMDGEDNYNGSAGKNGRGFRGKSTYREINNCKANENTANFGGNGAEQECTGWGENLGNWSGVHGMFYYDLFMGSWLIYPAVHQASSGGPEHYRTWVSYPMADSTTAVTFNPSDNNTNFDGTVAEWSMALHDGSDAVTWSTQHDLVVSSFPHNNLGQDFRFNLRVLQGAFAVNPAVAANTSGFFSATKHGSNQIYRSYYFYKINEINIRFPYFVAYALHHENRGQSMTTDTNARTYDGAPDVSDGSQDWNSKSGGDWLNGTRPATWPADAPWCDNLSSGDGQCHPAGQQWWNTLNNDIVHPLTYDANNELYRHMDTTKAIAWNKNPIMNLSSTNASDDLDDYQFMHNSMAGTRSNIIPPVDLGTHSPGVNKHSADGGGNIEFHRIMGFIRQPTNNDGKQGALIGTNGTDGRKYTSADWCDHTGGQVATGGSALQGTDMGANLLERTCGVDFRIVGLMNTYDERRGQRGTYQEIWVQLQYALGKGGRDGHLSSCGEAHGHSGCAVATHPIQSPHPYLHFMASEIISIQAECNVINVNNPNLCSEMSIGPGETNNAAYGGK